MGGLGLLLSRDLRDIARTAAFRVITAAFLLLAAALAAGAAGTILAPRTGAGAPDPRALVGAMLYSATFLPFLVFIWTFAGALLAKEKASGHLETLLATPLKARSLWLAKSAAITLPALAVAALSSALIAVAAAIAGRAIPDGVAFALPPRTLVVCLIGNPLLFSGLGALTVLIALRASPDAAIIPSFILGFGLMALALAGTALGFLDMSSRAFASAYMAAGFAEWLLVLALARGMTKERIVLSSRED